MAKEPDFSTQQFDCKLLGGIADVTYVTKYNTTKGIGVYGQVVDAATLIYKCNGFNKCGLIKSMKKDYIPGLHHHSTFQDCPANPHRML